MRTLDELLEAIREEAIRAEFPVDREIYTRCAKNPLVPILCAGTLDAAICVFGRDLGKDEVAEGQPLIGAAGRLVRSGIYRAFLGEQPSSDDRRLESALKHVLLTNTVPYKPPGNKAYVAAVKGRFRPFVAELLIRHWKGNRVICLGTEAFDWFAEYAEPGAADAFWSQGDDRYRRELPCVLVGDGHRKAITLAPLPHPSPLNQRWYKKFPDLLDERLRAVTGARDASDRPVQRSLFPTRADPSP
jgi:uracil-DNA glycosylase